jgi:hypothetical protein
MLLLPEGYGKNLIFSAVGSRRMKGAVRKKRVEQVKGISRQSPLESLIFLIHRIPMNLTSPPGGVFWDLAGPEPPSSLLIP